MSILINFSRIRRNASFFSSIWKSHNILKEVLVFGLFYLCLLLMFFFKIFSNQIINIAIFTALSHFKSLLFSCGCKITQISRCFYILLCLFLWMNASYWRFYFLLCFPGTTSIYFSFWRLIIFTIKSMFVISNSRYPKIISWWNLFPILVYIKVKLHLLLIPELLLFTDTGLLLLDLTFLDPKL